MTDNILNITNAIKGLFNNEFMSDIQFEFKLSSGLNQEPLNINNKLYAHSLILSTRSKTFAEEFKTSFKKFDSVIVISNITKNIFKEFLYFLYTDQCTLTSDNVQEISDLADLYIVPLLQTKCFAYMIEHLTTQNVFKIFEMALNQDLCNALKNCSEFIKRNFIAVTNDDKFLHINKRTLDIILKMDNINATETDVFKAALKWAEQSCHRMTISTTTKNKRTVLGDSIKLIRFPLMTAFEFGQCIALENGLLVQNEIAAILMEITGDIPNDLGFSRDKRNSTPLNKSSFVYLSNENLRTSKNEQVFTGTSNSSNKKVTSEYFITKFKTDKPIHISGLRINHSNANQKIKIRIINNKNILMHEEIFNTFSHIFSNCYFNQTIPIEAYEEYTIELDHTAPDSEFWCNDCQKMPIKKTHSIVEFEFNILSPIVDRIYFKPH